MSNASFGGTWTREKLDILRGYLDAYTTALKKQPFRLTYIDAFAGEGTWSPQSPYSSSDYDDFRELHKGSPRIALEIQDRPFDSLTFIEQDPDRCETLGHLKLEFPKRDIEVYNGDANEYLPRLCGTLGPFDRAVVFLDPFATEVSWATVESIARTKKIDCWILFPQAAIARMMPVHGEPPAPLADQLDRVFGGRKYWLGAYQQSPQFSFFDERRHERTIGSDEIAELYRQRLRRVFVKVASSGRELKNSKNSTMFQLLFAAGNPKGAPIAARIAKHLIDSW